MMELLDNEDNPEAELLTFEKVDDIRYLEAVLSTKNDWLREIAVRIAKTESVSLALNKL